MSLQTRLAAFIAAVGADIKDLQPRGGYCFNPDEETRTNTSYGLLPSPDVVEDVETDEGDIVLLGFQGMWKESVNNAGRAAIFIGSEQLKVAQFGVASPAAQEANVYTNANVYTPISSGVHGLVGRVNNHAVAYNGDVTTGQVLGVHDLGGILDSPNAQAFSGGFGFCAFHVAEGIHDISVQMRATGGATVTAKERKLWVDVRRFRPA